MLRTKWMAAFAAVLGLVALAAGGLDPASGTIGSTLNVSGLAFAPGKGTSARLVEQEGRMSFPLKVGARTADGFAAVVRSGRVGVYDLEVRAPGQAPVTIPESFTIAAPQPDGVVPPAAAAGLPVEIQGRDFGSAKGSVLVGGKQARVTEWTTSSIRCIVPRGLAAGPQPVVVRGRAGDSDGALTYDVITGEFLRFDVDGKATAFERRDAKKFTATFEGGCTCLGAICVKGGKTFAVTFHALDLGRLTPYTLDNSDFQGTYVDCAYRTGPNRLFGPELGAFHVTFTGFSGGFLEGTFEGTLLSGIGPGVPSHEITNGTFRLHFDSLGQ